MGKRKDNRPICTCNAYRFPHKVGGRCTGSSFAERYYWENRGLCRYCNCNRGDQCDVAVGLESIREAECYQEVLHRSVPGTRLIKTLAIL